MLWRLFLPNPPTERERRRQRVEKLLSAEHPHVPVKSLKVKKAVRATLYVTHILPFGPRI